MDLLECRNEIDKIDKELVELFEKRMNVAVNVAKYKIENNIPIFNGARELKLFKRILIDLIIGSIQSLQKSFLLI